MKDAKHGIVVRVVYLDRGENLPLSLGDRLRVISNDSAAATAAEHKKHVRCER